MFELKVVIFYKFIPIIIVFSLCQRVLWAKIVWKNNIHISSKDLEGDLERISSKLLKSLNLLVDESKLEQFHNLVNNQPGVRDEYKDIEFENYDYQIDYGKLDSSKNGSRKRLAESPIQDYGTTEKSFINGTEKEFEYDLEEFKKEYGSNIEIIPDIATFPPNSDNTSNSKPSDERPFHATEIKEYSDECLEMSLWKYIFFGWICLWHEVTHITSTGKFLNILIFLLKTLIVTFPMCVVSVVCMWCYNGMCSCLCPHPIFHPYREIKKIKTEALNTYPGKYIDKDGNEITYTPSEEELQIYKELLDLIYS